MKKLTSWLLVVMMLISCCAMMVFPAAASTAPFANLYDTDKAVAGRAVADMATTNTNELIYVTSNPVEVKAGETVYFGPLNVSQGYQAYFYPKNNTTAGTQIPAAQTPEAFKFEGSLRRTNADWDNKDKPTYLAVYSYTATEDGYIRCTLPIEYADFYVITKDVLTYDKYFAYHDSLPGVNLWNMYLDAKGLLNPDGTINSGNNNHSATHLIAVEEGDTITWGPHRDSLYYGAVGYNAQGEGCTNEIQVGTGNKPMSATVRKVDSFTKDNNPKNLDDSQTYGIYSYTVPAGVSYVRVITHQTGIADFMVQKNNEFDVEGYWKLMGGDMNSPYFNANSVWFGDSICQATQDLPIFDKSSGGVPTSTWYGGFVGRVSKAFNMTYDHNGESGWSLSTARPGRIVNRLIATQADEPAGGFDVVMLHGGTNDAWQSVPVGTMSDSYSPTAFDINTYAGALEELFYYATTLYGDTAEINYILNYDQPKKNAGQVWNMGPHYAEALKICAKWGVNAIDLFHDEEVGKACALYTNGEVGKIYRDGCHANLWGYNIISPFIAEKMLDATTGNTWLEDNNKVAGKIYSDLKIAIAKSAHFTAESKAAFTKACTGANNVEKLAAALAAAPALKQVEGKYIPVTEMTKYTFAKQKDFGVATVADLVWLSQYNNQSGNNNGKTNFGDLPGYIPDDYTIHQLNDIDMNSGHYNTGNYDVLRIGTAANDFKATYDGHGYKIKNWKSGTEAAPTTTSGATAIFHYTKNATIKNVTLENPVVYGGQHTGLLVSYAEGHNVIENCHVVGGSMTKTAGNGMAAILLQPATASAGTTDTYLVRNCTVSGMTFNISTNAASGNYGFIASRALTANNVIENCYSYNNRMIVNGSSNPLAVGGILGEAYDGTVKNCGSYGNIYQVAEGATGSFAATTAGLVGAVANATDTLYLDNSYSDMADYDLYKGNGTVVGTNNYSVKAGTTTAAEITDGTLATKLQTASGLRWENSDGEVSIPMVKENIVTLGGYTLYGATADGKITASEDVLAAIAGKIWRKGNVTLLTKDILAGTYALDESWAESAYLLGDCMGGNSLDTRDALALLQNVMGKTVDGFINEDGRADVNVDGKVTIADVCVILRYIARGVNAA